MKKMRSFDDRLWEWLRRRVGAPLVLEDQHMSDVYLLARLVVSLDEQYRIEHGINREEHPVHNFGRLQFCKVPLFFGQVDPYTKVLWQGKGLANSTVGYWECHCGFALPEVFPGVHHTHAFKHSEVKTLPVWTNNGDLIFEGDRLNERRPGKDTSFFAGDTAETVLKEPTLMQYHTQICQICGLIILGSEEIDVIEL